MPIDQKQIRSATRHLKTCDPVVRKIIAQAGPCRIPRQRSRFVTLVRSIVAQQISVAAARTINARLEKQVQPQKINASVLAEFNLDQLREAGVSRQKATYLLDLSHKVDSGQVNLRTLSRLTDDEIVQELCQVKGIGVWTAQMFMMFNLGRPNVLPTGDLGIQNAMRKNYQLRGKVTSVKMEKIARKWAPFRTIGCYYMWQSLTLE